MEKVLYEAPFIKHAISLDRKLMGARTIFRNRSPTQSEHSEKKITK